MNRQIKFRAWVPAMKKMHVWGVNLLRLNHDLSWESLSDGVFDKCNSTLMQFTQQHDRNGLEIYEGDIVQYIGKDNIWICSFERTGFKLTRIDDGCETWAQDVFRRCFVIGNIYQNKELININK